MQLVPVSFEKVKIDSPFWSPRMETASITANVNLEQCERSGRLGNFRRAAGREEGPFQGLFFDDSDVYKVIEGVAYTLMNSPNPELKAKADKVIDDICASQKPDGYINSYYSLTGFENRWTDMGMHEAYCIGHMIEGAIAYAQATGETALLNCARRAVHHMMDRFGEDKKTWVTGHEELELALIRLYRYTGDESYLDFAHWLLDQRGHGHMDAKSLGKSPAEYAQDHLPVAEQKKVVGHAVRAMYLYTGMADMDAITGKNEYGEALAALWQDTVPGNMYITGGIGQERQHEGFTRAWHKPNLTAYNETCAAIGMAMWNHRMSLVAGETRFADVVETELYNGILSGISLDGTHFFYENPLASVGILYHRKAWFGCSCCPTNLCRFIPSVGGYAYAVEGRTLHVSQYIGGCLDTDGIRMNVQTNYPWDGKIVFHIEDCSGFDALRLRIPGWCKEAVVDAPCTRHESSFVVPIEKGMTVTLMLSMPIERVYEDARVAECAGRVCVRKGPVVYCAEGVDNPGIPPEYFPAEISLPKEAPLTLGEPCAELPSIPCIQAGKLRLVPYYAWDNRGIGPMAVWLKEV